MWGSLESHRATTAWGLALFASHPCPVSLRLLLHWMSKWSPYRDTCGDAYPAFLLHVRSAECWVRSPALSPRCVVTSHSGSETPSTWPGFVSLPPSFHSFFSVARFQGPVFAILPLSPDVMPTKHAKLSSAFLVVVWRNSHQHSHYALVSGSLRPQRKVPGHWLL